MTRVTVIDPNPETEEMGVISGYPQNPVKLEVATKPQASIYSLSIEMANGVKYVGFIQVGGTVAQFEHRCFLQKKKNEAHGLRNGTMIHATAGTLVDHYEDYR